MSYRPRLNKAEAILIKKYRARAKERNVLVIPDLHAPFIREDFLGHCTEIYEKYQCNSAIFIGDIIDNHFSSFHSTDPDGYAAGEELDRARDQIKLWHDQFPDADIIMGNHDKIILRKMFKEGVSSQWVKSFPDVLKVPTWKFHNTIIRDGCKYIHGVSGGAVNGAMTKAKNRGINIIQGHWHSRSYVRWHATDNNRIFAMQVGCGVDEDSYAMAYNEDPLERWIISCGVVLENGNLPIIEPMKL